MTPAQRWWLQSLFWISTFYPLHIAAQVWVRVLPAYLSAWLFDAGTAQLRLDPYFLWAGARGGFATAFLTGTQAVSLAVSAVGVALLRLARNASPDLAGRAAAMIGLTLCGNWLGSMIFYNARPARGAVPGLAGLLIVSIGMRWAVSAVPGNFRARIGVVLTGMALPAAALPALFVNWDRAWIGVAGTIPVILLAAAFPVRIRAVPTLAGWRWVGAGCLLSLAVCVALLQGRSWQQRARESAVARLLAAVPKPRAGQPYPKYYFHRGVNFTANGYGYESPQARALLRRLPEYGIQAIAVVPYGGMDRRTRRITTASPQSWESDAGVEIISADAHALGMSVMLKPHVWRPRGDQPLNEDARRVWFRDYALFIEHYARLAQRIHADIFCIGVELGAFTGFEQEWRSIVARVRSLYQGPLVYAANHGEEFESIRFWDALDYIGLDNYYALPDDFSAAKIAGKAGQVAKRYNRPVLLTEAGCASAAGSHTAPWEDHPPRPLSLEEQARYYEAVFEAFYGQPWFAGVYWWKIETDGAGGPGDNSMVPWGKPAMLILKKWYSRKEAFHPRISGGHFSQENLETVPDKSGNSPERINP